MKQEIFKVLDLLKIEYKNYEHLPVFTCDEAKWVDVPWERVKSLLLRNKNKTRFYMLVLWDKKQLDSNKLRKIIKENKISFTTKELMNELIWVEPGHVSPFAMINNVDKNIKVLFDIELKDKLIGFHPGQNNNTTVLNITWVEKFLSNLGFEYEYIDLESEIGE